MVTPGGTFERVLAGLRLRLSAGTFALGDPLEPAHLAAELNASITPVRDALHRLVGERLVETAPGGGFRTPLLTEVGLRHLYGWHHRLVMIALADLKSDGLVVEDAGDDVIDRISSLFAAIASAASNPECTTALASVASRLRSVRLKETEILGAQAVDAELSALLGLTLAGDWTGLRRTLRHYHRSRERIVGDLVAALHHPSIKT